MSLQKKFHKSNDACTVTFRLPKEAVNGAHDINLLGDFNDWDIAKAVPMKASKNGAYQVSIDLESGKEYQFRYLLDGKTWENDWEADGYAPTPFGVENSVVVARA